jgi:hypothetical protein
MVKEFKYLPLVQCYIGNKILWYYKFKKEDIRNWLLETSIEAKIIFFQYDETLFFW